MALDGNEKNKSIKDWGKGIPNYSNNDLMTEYDKLNFAMNIVKQCELDKNGYSIIAATDQVGQIPNFVCEKDGNTFFIVVKCDIAPEMPVMSVEEKKHVIQHANKYNAICYFAPVSIGSMDGERFDASLALKYDGYYSKYLGLERIVPKHSTEWIQRALAEIDKLNPNIQPQTIVEPSSDVRYSIKVEWTDFDEWQTQLLAPTFQEMLFTCIQRKGLSNTDFYKAATLDRKLFSAMKNNRNYQPKKETAVACCFGLGLNLSDAEKLLELAGYKLSLSITWDRVIYYCLKNGIFDIDSANELLYEAGEKCIRV